MDRRQARAAGPRQGDARRIAHCVQTRFSVPDFWRSCGYRLLKVGGDGRLTVTDDFLRTYLTRPELAPIPESCAAENALHDALMTVPR
ncbi:MAG: DUF6352 family protein, partial [Casimicrobiaceae bacterium]